MTAKQYTGLLGKVQRLLELKPDHVEAGALAARLEQFEQRNFKQSQLQLAKAAQAKYAKHDYAEAATLLSRIHPTVRSPDEIKLLELAEDRAQEVAWLWEDLRNFAVIDEHLRPLAERLVKLRPNDEQAAKLATRIVQLDRQRVEQQDLPKPRPCKTATQFGYPVDLLVGCRRIDDKKLRALAEYRNNASAFYVAFGLALQGLDKASVQTNLLPNQKKGVLSRLAGSMLKKKAKAAWGFDVGQSAIKAVKLSWDAEHDRPCAEAGELIEFDKPLTQPDAEPERQLRAAIEKLLEKHQLDEDTVCVGFPGSKTLARFIKLPPTEEDKVAELVKYEARLQIPFALDTVTWDYHTSYLGREVTPGVCEREVAIFALRTVEAVQYLFPLNELKLKIDVLQCESVALHNYLSFDRFALDSTTKDHAAAQQNGEAHTEFDEVTAVLDIGSDCTHLIVGSSHSMWVRTISMGAGQFNKPLIEQFHLTHEKAELLKRNPVKAPLVSAAYRSMVPAMRDLVGEVQRSLTYYEHTFRQRRITQMYIVGNGTRLHGLLKMLRSGNY